MDSATDKTTAKLPAAREDEYEEIAWGLESREGEIKPMKIPRGNVKDGMVKFEVLYCGVCHSDVHWGRDEQLPTQYPLIAGHEMTGQVVEVGAGVTKFKVGDNIGVGCMVDCCGKCDWCTTEEQEQYCDEHMTMTYNGPRVHGNVPGNPELMTFGGYSKTMVVHEKFCFTVPEGMDLAKTAPIFCAGITMFDPLHYYGYTTSEPKVVGICGIGGLGTMGIKLAKAMGHKVVAISSSNKKEAVAKEKGADIFVNISDPESVKACGVQCHLILDTVSAQHDLNQYIPLLRKCGTISGLGAVYEPHPISQLGLMGTRQHITSSMIGSLKAHQDLVDFCFKKSVYPDIEIIEAKDLTATWEKLSKGDPSGLRYVLDVKKSLENKDFV